MTMFRGWAAPGKGAELQRFDFDPGALGPEEVEIAVEHCGICHSDLAMVDSEWFPVVIPPKGIGLRSRFRRSWPTAVLG